MKPANLKIEDDNMLSAEGHDPADIDGTVE
jgi:hypothetical protein